MKKWRRLEHTADLYLEGTGATGIEAVEALAEGLIAQLSEVPAKPLETREVGATGIDLEDTVVSFMGEINYLVQGLRWLPAACEMTVLAPTSAKARLTGEPLDPARHVPQEIKAATLHGFLFEEGGGTNTVRVLFDL